MKNLLTLSVLFFLIACSNKKAVKTTSAATELKVSKSGIYPTVDNLEIADKAYILTKVSDDPEYGYTAKKPIKVASIKSDENIARNEYLYMNALLGPNGEEVEFHRTGSCCAYKSDSPKAFLGSALLDKFEVTTKGSNEKKILYLDMYESGLVVAPVGFTFRK